MKSFLNRPMTLALQHGEMPRASCVPCRLTFELSGSQRLAAMSHANHAGGSRPAVGSPLERRVRPHSTGRRYLT